MEHCQMEHCQMEHCQMEHCQIWRLNSRARGVYWTGRGPPPRFRGASCAAGWVAERFKAAVLKTANPQGFVGSNPTPSANSEQICERRA
jgi:hypothetical protein